MHSDSHCHLPALPSGATEFAIKQHVDEYVASIPSCPSLLCICATSPTADWDALAHFAQRGHPQFVVGFGIHPWWVPDCLQLPWEQRLRELLARYPNAFVGEVGLDKNRPQWDDQVAVFQRQLRIAAEFRRPISIHCVRAFGAIVDVIREIGVFPPSIIFHGYSGSIDFARSLIKMSPPRRALFYFGFGVRTTAKLRDFSRLCMNIPRNLILLESDAFSGGESHDNVASICAAIAQCWESSTQEVVELTNCNALKAFQCPDSQSRCCL